MLQFSCNNVSNSAFILGHISLDKLPHMLLKSCSPRCSTEAFTLATRGVTCRATCIEECAQCRSLRMCPRMCPCFSVEPFILRHMSTQCDVIARIKYRRCRGHARTLSPHMCPEYFHTRIHVAQQINRHVE